MMELFYEGKKTERAIRAGTPIADLYGFDASKNTLIFGDNLPVLRALSENPDVRGKIDLIYIDPPFSTNTDFTFGKTRVSTISSKKSDVLAYSDRRTGADFIEFLRERLIFAKDLLSPRGSIYLHIDYKIGHYVKLIMDEIFGAENFRNDITRIKCNPKNFSRKAYGNVKDLILFYSKSSDPIWNEPRTEYSAAERSRLFPKRDSAGRAYTTIPLHAPGETQSGPTGGMFRGMLPPPGRHWRSAPEELQKLDDAGEIEWSKNGVPRRKIFADRQQGKKMQDIWDFKDPQYPRYPTEKNKDLLEAIIRASSEEGSIVLDFFCGSGTTLDVAQELRRQWIGIDSSEIAISVARERLEANASFHFIKSQVNDFVPELVLCEDVLKKEKIPSPRRAKKK
ncbi:MAG: site-specific DNA-methyltransferase [Opitutales bacterium]|nr:site-specific DNA-methyltransferase [Opitutales bacterium]